MVYIPKDYHMICDRCGGQFRRSQMKENWEGLMVCKKYCFETRHPQDFVEAIPDDPSVPVSRPDVIQSVGETTVFDSLVYTSLAWSTTIYIVPVIGLAQYDPIGVKMDNGATHWSFIEDETITVTTSEPLLFEDGGLFYDPDYVIIESEGEVGSGYIQVTLNSPTSYLCSGGNSVYLPSINNESWQ